MQSKRETQHSSHAKKRNATRTTTGAIGDGSFLSSPGEVKAVVTVKKNDRLFSQGNPGDTVFYIQKGQVKLTVISQSGKEATVALLGPGDFVGQECLAADQTVRLVTATAITDTTLVKIAKKEMIDRLHEDQSFTDFFSSFLLQRSIRIQADLIDQLFNSSEKRLARLLLLMAQYGKGQNNATRIPKISQETMATMIGTTRGRVNYFLNRFRKLGFIRYNGGVEVNSSLLNVVLND